MDVSPIAAARVAAADRPGARMARAGRLAAGLVPLGAVVVGAVSLLIWSSYYRSHPLWVEHAAYGLWANITFSDALGGQTYWTALWALASSARYILQPALVGLLWPPLLSSPHAHILVTAAALYLFLYLLFRFVSRRTENAWLGAAAVVLFCALPGLYDERNGLGAPWPDYQSMLLLSAAMLSFALYAISARPGWLGLAGACVSLATLARDTGAVYAAVTCLPAVLLLAVCEIRQGRGLRGLLRLGLWCGIPTIPAIIVVIRKLAFFQQYYMTSNVSQLRQPTATALVSIWELLSEFTGMLFIGGTVALIAGAVMLWPRRKWSIADAIVIAWPLSYFVFLAVNGYTSDVTKEVMYLAPGLVCVAVALAGGIDVQSRAACRWVVVVVAVCVVGAAGAAVGSYSRASLPSADAAALRQSQKVLAAALASIPQRVVWQSYSAYDWGTVLAVLTFYDFGRYQPTENAWFHNRKNYWDAAFPNMNLAQLQEHVLAQTNDRIDVAIVLKNAHERPSGMEDYSFSIASFIARRIQADSSWTHYRDVSTSVSGPLALYVNRRRVSLGGR